MTPFKEFAKFPGESPVLKDPDDNRRRWSCLYACVMCGLVTIAAILLHQAAILCWYVLPYKLVYEAITGLPLIKGRFWRWMEWPDRGR